MSATTLISPLTGSLPVGTIRVATQIDTALATAPFVPLSLSLAEIRSAIPPPLFEKRASVGLRYVIRDVLIALCFFKLAAYIDPVLAAARQARVLGPVALYAAKVLAWSV